jgi:hypothetical protein
MALLAQLLLCGFLREQKYGSLITEKAWPALAATLPVSNHTPIPDATIKVKAQHCFTAKVLIMLKMSVQNLRQKGRKKQRNHPLHRQPSPLLVLPHHPWLLGITSNLLIQLVLCLDGVTYKWFQECCCHDTGKQGYFTRTHFTAEHVRRNVSFSSPSANHSLLVPLIPDSGDFTLDSIPLEEQLVFTGPWHCEVEVKLPVEIASHVSSGELDVPSVSDTTCVFGVFHPTANMMEIPNFPIDGVESITFTIDEDQAINIAATNAIGINAMDTVGHANAPISDVPVATLIPSPVPTPSALLLSHTNDSYVFLTLVLCCLLSTWSIVNCVLATIRFVCLLALKDSLVVPPMPMGSITLLQSAVWPANLELDTLVMCATNVFTCSMVGIFLSFWSKRCRLHC